MKATEFKAMLAIQGYAPLIQGYIQCGCRWRNASEDHDSSYWW